MIKTRIILSVASVLMATSILYAQSNIGVDSYYLGDYEKAEAYLKKNITENPASFNYYLGEIAFSEGDVTKAESYYNEGLRADAESALNKIGLAKIKLKTNAKEAEIELNEITKKNKKDIDIALATGRAYLSNGMAQQAMQQVDAAKKINDKNPDIYILEGDIIVSGDIKEKVGSAAGKYEMAIYFSPDFALGYMKVAQVYEYINSPMAIDKLKTIIEKQPDYMPAYSYLGKLYAQNGFYQEAIALYKTYFQSGIYTVEDIERYARAYYFTDNYPQAEKLVDEGLSKSPEHFVLNRYKMYIADKTKNSDQGINIAGKFFALRDTGGYIAKDYAVYASILNKNKTFNEAYTQYNKAISIEPQTIELYTEAASMARENKHYAVAASYLKKQMAEKIKLSGNVDYPDNAIDLAALGYDYYSAGVSISKNEPLTKELMQSNDIIKELTASQASIIVDSLNNVNYFSKIYASYCLNKADSVFDILISHVPDSYIGYRYKALTLHALNPDIEQGSAKPYYEKVVGILTKDEKEPGSSDKKVLLEAFNYLGYYYYMKSDKDNTISLWKKVLELDPENKNAKLVLEDMEKK